MIAVAMRTDNPQAELYLFQDGQLTGQVVWEAHRELSRTIHTQLRELLQSAGLTVHSIKGVILFQGPGSFTGLRIGVSVANGLGAALGMPVVATRGDNWQQAGLQQLRGKKGFTPVEPFYGADPHITTPKK